MAIIFIKPGQENSGWVSSKSFFLIYPVCQAAYMIVPVAVLANVVIGSGSPITPPGRLYGDHWEIFLINFLREYCIKVRKWDNVDRSNLTNGQWISYYSE